MKLSQGAGSKAVAVDQEKGGKMKLTPISLTLFAWAAAMQSGAMIATCEGLHALIGFEGLQAMLSTLAS